MADLDPPFGTYALPPAKEKWRVRASCFPDTKWGKARISICRKRAKSGLSEPFDIEIEDGVKARLYPSGSRCEKSAFAGVQTWDAAERGALERAVQSGTQTPFVFLDVGAAAGLYSLFVNAYAKSASRSAQIIAVEPGLETCGRLEINIAASGADVQIIRAAISDAPGTGFLNAAKGNRGEAQLVSGGHNVEAVVIDTLARICRTQGLTHVDAMKLDIAGHDFKALTGFFEDAPERLHPGLLILETGREGFSPLIELCEMQGYKVAKRCGLNTILEKENHVQT